MLMSSKPLLETSLVAILWIETAAEFLYSQRPNEPCVGMHGQLFNQRPLMSLTPSRAMLLDMEYLGP